MNKYQEALDKLHNPLMPQFKNIEEATPYYEARKKQKDTLQELVDRATPKKVIYEKLGGEPIATCPNCHKGVFEHDAFNTKIMYSGQFCSHCGQSLEWEEGEKK